MADTIDLTPLLLEIRETNRLTQSLRDLAIKDDTPAERVKDQLPEILAEKRFIDKQMNQAEDLNIKAGKAFVEPFDKIITGLAEQNQEINDFLVDNAHAVREFVDIQTDTLNETKKQTAILNMNALGIEKMVESFDKNIKLAEETDKAFIEAMKTQTEQIESASPFVNDLITKEDESKKVKPKPKTGKEEEEQKDDRDFLQKTVGFLTSPIKSLKS